MRASPISGEALFSQIEGSMFVEKGLSFSRHPVKI